MSLEDFSFIDTNGDGFGDLDAADRDGDGILDPYAFDTSFNGVADYDGGLDSFLLEGVNQDGTDQGPSVVGPATDPGSEQAPIAAGFKKP